MIRKIILDVINVIMNQLLIAIVLNLIKLKWINIWNIFIILNDKFKNINFNNKKDEK